MWESVLSEDLLRAKKKKHAKTFAEKCSQMLTFFHLKYLPGRDFPHTVLQSQEFSFSALKSVSNEFCLLSK